MAPDFVHLHTHSYFSILTGLSSPEALVRRAAELGQPALALTDYNNMFGAVRFYRAARAAGVKPILGLQLAIGQGGYPLTLLAETRAGYRNLLHLATAVRTERPLRAVTSPGGAGLLDVVPSQSSPGGVPLAGAGWGGGPDPAATGSAYGDDGTVSLQLVYEYCDGLIVLSGGHRGELATLVAAGRTAEALQLGARMREVFGEHNFYIELQNQGLSDQCQLNESLMAVAAKLNVGVVATNDVRYLHEEDARAHAALLAMKARTTLTDPARPTMGSARFWLTSGADMASLLGEFPEALANTAVIAERCHVQLDTASLRLPDFWRGDNPTAGAGDHDGAARLLEENTRCGAGERFGLPLPADVEQRLRHELDIIVGRGLAAYFLIVADIVAEARRRGMPVGPGRGSAASSLVAYCLRITDVNPLQYGLVFERFLNPERVGMPDIDVDVGDIRRDELLHYIRERFGQNNVAQIVTFGTLAARAALRETGKVLAVPRPKIDRLVRLLPNEAGMTLDRAEREVPGLTRVIRADAEVQRLWALAKVLEGIPRHLSTHAAGVVIGAGPLIEDFPLIVTSEQMRLTQYPMDDAEALGFLKMDLLGLRTLTVIEQARSFVAEGGGANGLPKTLPLDDEAVYESLRKNGTDGVFQLETPMFRKLVRRLQPTTFADIVALLALGRPGPMQRVEQFIGRRHGRVPVQYVHDALESILEETYGIIIYQEQVMHIAMVLAGYTPAEADLLRRRLTDAGPNLSLEERERFLVGAEGRGIGRDAAQRVLDDLQQFAGYGFAKSHSVAYATLTYETAWLRTHFPAAFFAALLSTHKGNPESVRRYVDAAKAMGTPVLTPDVNTSGVDFAPHPSSTGEGQVVSFGLAGLRHVGPGAARAIVDARSEGPFSSFDEFYHRLPPAHRRPQLIAALVEAGACDSLGSTREQMLATVGYGDGAKPRSSGVGQSSPTDVGKGQRTLFSAAPAEGSPRNVDVSDMINVKDSGFVLQLAPGQERHWPKLQALLSTHKGEVPVTIKVPTPEGVVSIAVDRGLWVDGGPRLLSQLEHWRRLGRLTAVTRIP